MERGDASVAMAAWKVARGCKQPVCANITDKQ